MYFRPPVYESTADVPKPAGGEATRQEVRSLLLSNEAEYTSLDGMVRVEHHGQPPLSIWAADFGECADASCGCYRIAWPNVRRDFRNLVVLRTAAAATVDGADMAGLAAVRYVSVGCGSLLSDFEILCGLQAKRLPISSIIVVDTCYGERPSEHHLACFKLLAGFFHPARVAAFSSLELLQGAALGAPDLYGRATTYVHLHAEPFARFT